MKHAPEIEITDQMISAGAGILAECEDSAATPQHIARRVYQAMEHARLHHQLLNALRRLLSDSQYKDHPEASQMAIDAIVAATGKHPREQ